MSRLRNMRPFRPVNYEQLWAFIDMKKRLFRTPWDRVVWMIFDRRGYAPIPGQHGWRGFMEL